ncbi:MAG TPA: universal stress protein, partial [Acidimicrobiia bacterium]|nr:universal stress protein [Acidimicrobiia bacterium]
VVASDRELDIIDEELSKEGITYSIHNFVRGNAPAEDIVQAANDLGGELIVIGLRQRTSAGKFLLGSNAHDILMSAPCPVLTIRV